MSARDTLRKNGALMRALRLRYDLSMSMAAARGCRYEKLTGTHEPREEVPSRALPNGVHRLTFDPSLARQAEEQR